MAKKAKAPSSFRLQHVPLCPQARPTSSSTALFFVTSSEGCSKPFDFLSMRRLAALATTTMAAARALSTGAKVPSFSVLSHTGETVTETTAGKEYLLWFYPKADTGG